MKEQFEALKNGCPWRFYLKYSELYYCSALAREEDDSCHYKNCALLYWLRHLKEMESAESAEK